MSEIYHPHDKFVKDMLSRPGVTKDFLDNYLPAEILRILDLSTLELTKDSFVDKELREHFSDLLCKVRLKKGKKAYVYILMEHKSYLDPLTLFQVLRYMVRIWEQAVRKHEKDRKKMSGKKKKIPQFRLPLIIPLVIYHGETKWNISSDFSSLFETYPELESFVPDFSCLTFDISHYDDDDIKGMVMLKVGLLIMKYVFRDDLGERLPEILGLLSDLARKRTGLEYLETIITYLVKGTDRITEKEMAEAVESALSSGGEFMATLAEKWLRQGEIKGKIEGLLSGIETGLELKFGSEGLQILPEIQGIQDVSVLDAVNKGLRTKNSLDELRKIYRDC